MKYQNLPAFEKYLATNPIQENHLYLIIVGDDWERSQRMQDIVKRLKIEGGRVEVYSPEDPFSSIFDALQTPSLFGGEAVVVLDGCELLKKQQVEQMGEFLKAHSFSGYLILGSSGKTALSKVVEGKGVVFDLGDEKPWDREKRLSHSLIEKAKLAGKWLSADAASLLLERIGMDASSLSQEVDKLICYVGDRPTIERADIFRISASAATSTLWEMAEAFVWEGKKEFDDDAFPQLLFALRSQFQMGLKMASLIEEKAQEEAWSVHFPKMWPRTLEKRKEQARQKGSLFFKKGLESLYKIEMLSRGGSSQTGAFLDFLLVQMRG